MLDALRAGLVVPFDVVHEVVRTFELPLAGRTIVRPLYHIVNCKEWT